MKVSNIGFISQKLGDLDSQFPVQDMLLRTGQLEQYSGGIFGLGHIPYLVEQNIKAIISRILTKHNCVEVSLPLLQPEKIWADSGRLQKYVENGQMFRCLTDKGNFCLAPTAEEAIVEFAMKRLTSHKDLPKVFFQIGAKFRNEIRHRGYLLRGKAFDMMDAYSFCKTQDEQNAIYDEMKAAYKEIFEELGLAVQPVAADNGDIGGDKSEEYMSISPIGEDNVLIDVKTGLALNSELLDRKDAKEYLEKTYNLTDIDALEQKKAIELGHIFDLGKKYSSTMKGVYIDNDGKQQNYIMGCYGIGVSRTLAYLYENSIVTKDGKFDGICLPKSVAPYLFYIIAKTDDEEKFAIANNLHNSLNELGIDVLFDDRKDVSIGAKIKDAKLTGVSYIIVMGKSLDEGFVEIEELKTGEKIRVATADLVKEMCNVLKN